MVQWCYTISAEKCSCASMMEYYAMQIGPIKALLHDLCYIISAAQHFRNDWRCKYCYATLSGECSLA